MANFKHREMAFYPSKSKMERTHRKAASYRDYVDVMCSRNPSLLNLRSFLFSTQTSRRTFQITALDFRHGIKHPITRDLPDVIHLPRELNGIRQPGDEPEGYEEYHRHALQGRMLIIEDLTPDVIELLGSNLDIDPLFFASHLHTAQRNDMRYQGPDEVTLPSRLVSQNYMATVYHRPLICDKKPPDGDKFRRDMAIDRKLVFIRSTSIGLAQHCVSIIKVQQSSDFWIALLLVDPPISDSYFSSGRNDKEGTKTNLSLRPFRGFCEDFLDAPKFSSDWMSLADTPRGGMASEVVLYWERNIPSCFNAQNPTLESLAYYPFNIVAAEWVKYVAVMHNCIKMYEYHGDQLPSLDQFNTDLRELQVWRRRSMVSQQKLRSIIGQLKARHCHKTTQNMSDISLLVEDFEVICTKIEDAGRRLENMLPVVTSLVQIIDARRSFAETTNISRLTILALTFVPLSFVSSLFSMNDYNAPGARGFWVYFAVAIPITLLVFLVARPPTKLIKRCLEWFKAPMKRPLAVRRLSRDVAKGKVTEA